jgi:hypothetical protein
MHTKQDILVCSVNKVGICGTADDFESASRSAGSMTEMPGHEWRYICMKYSFAGANTETNGWMVG